MNITPRKACAILAAAVGLVCLSGSQPAQAQSSYSASPFIVGTAEHGFADRPSGTFSFTNGAATGANQGLTLNAHVDKRKTTTLAEIGTLLALGLMGLHSYYSGSYGNSGNLASFASNTGAPPPSTLFSGLTSGSGPTGGPLSRPTPAPVPELGTGAGFGLLVALGAAGMMFSRRKRPLAA